MGFYDHPAFQGIDKNFLVSLERQFKAIQGKGSNEVMVALISIAAEAKKYNVSLTPERQQVLMQYLRSNLPANKRSQFDSLVTMLMQQQK